MARISKQPSNCPDVASSPCLLLEVGQRSPSTFTIRPGARIGPDHHHVASLCEKLIVPVSPNPASLLYTHNTGIVLPP